MMRLLSSGTMPMSEGSLRAGEIFMLACVLGILLGACCDLLRALRRGLRTGAVTEQLLDLFCAVIFCFCWFMLSAAQTGRLRFFPLIGMLLGAAAERYTAGRGIVFVFSHIFSGLRTLWKRTGGILTAKIRQKAVSFFVENISNFKILKKSRKRS
ncbi:MAG: hypothetical protein IKP47_08005 [Ruminococcus sp.]|nr:hypothetical protein [Ruminococcus sp.]